jgi:hypothetical protein
MKVCEQVELIIIRRDGDPWMTWRLDCIGLTSSPV